MNERYHWRVTKYDPRHRDPSGAYTRDEWTGAAQIGRTFAAGAPTRAEYLRVEGLYADAAAALWNACGAPGLAVRQLEPGGSFGLPPQGDDLGEVGFGAWSPAEGARVTDDARLRAVVRWCLRELGWCVLQGAGFYVRFGYDFYMYVGSARASEKARRDVERSGLFVEPWSPPPPEV